MSVMNGHPPEAPPEAPGKERDEWRDEKGRYLLGNPGGPGNPVARELARLRQRLRERLTDAMFDDVVLELYGLCRKGSLGAIKLLMEYKCGKPDTSVDADRLGLHEAGLRLEGAALVHRADQAGVLLWAPPPQVPAAEPAVEPEP